MCIRDSIGALLRGIQRTEIERGQVLSKPGSIHPCLLYTSMIDSIKAQGYKYYTKSGITVAVCDAIIPPNKQELLEAAEEKVDAITAQYKMGLLSS